MKFAIVKTDLIKPLSHINSVVERKNAIAILSNLVIEAAGNEINFIATDMEIDLKEKILSNIISDGTIRVGSFDQNFSATVKTGTPYKLVFTPNEAIQNTSGLITFKVTEGVKDDGTQVKFIIN